MDSSKYIPIGEVSRLFNISKATVNYYTNLGLINVVRKIGNKRLYSREDVNRRIHKIRELLNKGYTLKVIKNEFFK